MSLFSHLRAVVCSCCLLMAASAHAADNFSFSYRFDDESVIAGKFQGNAILNGGILESVTNIFDIQLKFKNDSWPMPVNLAGWMSSPLVTLNGYDGSDWIIAPVISVNPLNNNFRFLQDNPDSQAVFLMTSPDPIFPLASWSFTIGFAPDDGVTNYTNGGDNPFIGSQQDLETWSQKWSLTLDTTPPSTNVPEISSTIGLLVSSFFGLTVAAAGIRRRSSSVLGFPSSKSSQHLVR